jgi:hypothetical protein
MIIRHMIAAGLFIGASMAQAAPVVTSSNVAGWTIQDSTSSWLPFFAPILEGSGATGEFTLQQNNTNGVVVFLRSIANVRGIGMFIGADGSRRYGFILNEPFKPAPQPVAAVEDAVAAPTVTDEVVAGGGAQPLIEDLQQTPPLAAPVAVALPAAADVPEPATGALLLAGLGGAALLARRRKG